MKSRPDAEILGQETSQATSQASSGVPELEPGLEPAAVSSLELSMATRLQRVERLRRLSDQQLRRYAVTAAAERDVESLWELMEAYLTLNGTRGVDTSRHTLRAYRRGLEALLVAWSGENLLRPGRDAGSDYVQRMLAGEVGIETKPAGRGRRAKRGPLARATVSLRVAAARVLYDALAWAGATEADPFRAVKLGKPRASLADNPGARIYSETELSRLLDATRDQQERVILLLGSHAGLRVSEMLALTWGDVDHRSGELLVARGKGGKAATVVMSVKLSSALLTYRRAQEARGIRGEAVLELRSQFGVYNRLRKVCVRAEVTFKGVHALRHSAGTRLYQRTGDLGLVQDHLRHATLDMARRYARSDRRKLAASVTDWD